MRWVENELLNWQQSVMDESKAEKARDYLDVKVEKDRVARFAEKFTTAVSLLRVVDYLCPETWVMHVTGAEEGGQVILSSWYESVEEIVGGVTRLARSSLTLDRHREKEYVHFERLFIRHFVTSLQIWKGIIILRGVYECPNSTL